MMRRTGGAGVALLGLCTLACLSGLACAGKYGTEYSPSIVLTNMGEMGAPCLQMVDRAATFNAKTIKFVPTVHYNGDERQINSYCFRNANYGCDAPTPAIIEQYTSLLATCMARAVSKGLGVGVLAHLDNQVGYTWRNLLQFSPLTKYGGWSYVDVVLNPMATAVSRVINKNTEVVFTLEGETGKSVSQHSKEWLGLVKYVKDRINASGRSNPAKILIAVSLNYNKVFGWIDFDTIKPSEIAAQFAKNFNEQKGKYPMDLPNMKALYDAVDVIGVSAYPTLAVDFKQEDLEIDLKYHDLELSYAGIDLKGLIAKGKRLVISEWGVGGGVQDGNAIAASVADVAAFPFFGLWYPFARSKNPWSNAAFNAYRQKLYSATATWLKNRGGPTYRVDGLYVWNAGSWDAMGVHFGTSNSEGTWADAGIQNTVRTHNAAVNRA